MDNPGLRTLLTFLDQVRRNAPVNFSKLSDERRKGYGMLSRYIVFASATNVDADPRVLQASLS